MKRKKKMVGDVVKPLLPSYVTNQDPETINLIAQVYFPFFALQKKIYENKRINSTFFNLLTESSAFFSEKTSNDFSFLFFYVSIPVNL